MGELEGARHLQEQVLAPWGGNELHADGQLFAHEAMTRLTLLRWRSGHGPCGRHHLASLGAKLVRVQFGDRERSSNPAAAAGGVS
jgi:hypothetical protein